MNSSTSSSDTRRRTRAMLIALMFLVALALIEYGTRAAPVPGSVDIIRYRSFPVHARILAGAPAPSIVFIGNSVTDRVLTDVLESEWKAITGGPLVADKFVTYNSNLTSWYWMSNQYFWKQDLRPDLIVVTYYDELGLADSPVMDIGAMAQFFTDAGDRPSLFEHDVTSLRKRAEYMLSSASLWFAMRDRIRVRTLNKIPKYQVFANMTNAYNFQYEQGRRMADATPVPTFGTLRRFVTRAQQEGVRLCFVAFRRRPGSSRATYEIRPEVLDAIADGGMLHLDFRHLEVLSS